MVGETRKLKWSLDDLDLTKPIEPLERFIDEPEKLIDEAFRIAAQYLPKDIVPSTLKDIPTIELKKLCLEQLKKIERTTLLNILTDGDNEGNDKDGPSEDRLTSEDADPLEPVASGSGKCAPEKSKAMRDAEIQVVIRSEVGAGQGMMAHGQELRQAKRRKEGMKESVSSYHTESEEIVELREGSQDDDPDQILDRAELEIRELELRAKAIRELLKKHEETDLMKQRSLPLQRTTQSPDKSAKESRKRSRAEANISEIKGKSTKADRKAKPDSKSISSRSYRNPISMVEDEEDFEDDELEEGETISQVREWERRKEGEQSEKGKGEEEEEESGAGVGGRRRRDEGTADQSLNESNIMIQFNNESDDSIDRELKGE